MKAHCAQRPHAPTGRVVPALHLPARCAGPARHSDTTSFSLAVAASTETARTAGSESAKLVLPIYQPKREINWGRWETLTVQRIEEREKQEAARRASGEATSEAQADPDSEDTSDDPALPSTSTSEAVWAAHFRQYDNPAVHQRTWQDAAYVRAWTQAIERLGPEHIRGKTVLDVGCGLGVLTLLCAKAGAKRVVALDASQAMVDTVRQVAAANGYESVIEPVCGRVEELTLRERVDVMVSDWPGHALLAGGMLPALAHARKHLLKPGGLVLPSHASLHVSGIECRAALAEQKTQWENIAGVDLTPVMSRVIATPHPATHLTPTQVCTTSARIASIDLARVSAATARKGVVDAPWQVTCERDGRLFGLALHFDLAWAAPGPSASAQDDPASTTTQPAGTAAQFSTNPCADSTHFCQVQLTFPRSIPVRKGDVLRGSLSLRPSGLVGADLDITLSVEFAGVKAQSQYTLVHSAPV